jgi:hypothetical protein
LGTGAGLIVTGIALQTGEANADFNFTGTGVAIAGMVVSLFSIRFFKKAAKYRKEANTSVSFKYQPVPKSIDTGYNPQKNSGMRHKPIPAVSILFNL